MECKASGVVTDLFALVAFSLFLVPVEVVANSRRNNYFRSSLAGATEKTQSERAYVEVAAVGRQKDLGTSQGDSGDRKIDFFMGRRGKGVHSYGEMTSRVSQRLVE